MLLNKFKEEYIMKKYNNKRKRERKVKYIDFRAHTTFTDKAKTTS